LTERVLAVLAIGCVIGVVEASCGVFQKFGCVLSTCLARWSVEDRKLIRFAADGDVVQLSRDQSLNDIPILFLPSCNEMKEGGREKEG
jgi:hypothetical protein